MLANTFFTIITFYFRINDDISGCPGVQNFKDNYGSCNQIYTNYSKYWVAINNGKDYCGEKIFVSFENSTFSNNLTLTIMDRCIMI